MTFILKEIEVENFKSIKHLHVKLEKFNVLIGPNGSGKTNFVEVFKFVKNALLASGRPYIPYLDWWSYKNIVWTGNEALPIKVKIVCTVNKLNVEYEFAVGWIDGSSKILVEKLDIEKIITIIKEGSIIQVKHAQNFLDRNRSSIEEEVEQVNTFLSGVRTLGEKRKLTIDSLINQSYQPPKDFINLIMSLWSFSIPSAKPRKLSSEIMGTWSDDSIFNGPLVVSPFREESKRIVSGLVPSTVSEIRNAIARFTILKHPNIREMKTPMLIGASDLSEDSVNLVSVLYQWFAQKLTLPEKIETFIKDIFPDTVISFGFTSDGKVFLKMNEKGVEINPPGIPDGLYKLLSIVVATELNCSVLAIDEIENSLYKQALEYAIDELRESGTTVIITTHSPLVVDMVHLEDLLITERTAEGTTIQRIKDPDEVRRKLADLKITQSESWLFEGLKPK